MMPGTKLSAQQLLALSDAIGRLGDGARSVLSDDSVTLSVDQSNLVASDMTSLYNCAASVVTQAAAVAFDDADAAFESISDATKSGADALATLQAKATEVNKIVGILGAGVSLGVAIGTGNVAAILSGAGSLRAAAKA